MTNRGLVSPKGEPFAYLEGGNLYTLDGELTGRLEGDLIVDTQGQPVWRVIGDGVYSLDLQETVGFLTTPRTGPPD